MFLLGSNFPDSPAWTRNSKGDIQGLHAAKMFLVTAKAYAIRFTTDDVALNYLPNFGPYENGIKTAGRINIARSYVGPMAFANR